MTLVGIAFSFLPDWKVVDEETRGEEDAEPALDALDPRDRWDLAFPGDEWGSCWSTICRGLERRRREGQ